MARYRNIDPPLSNRPRLDRATQRNLLPTAVKERQWLSGGLYRFTVATTFTDILTLSNGEDDTVTLTFSHSKLNDLLTPEIYVAYYQTSVASANQIPGGSSITESQWVFTSPFFDYGSWDKTRYESVVTFYIRNVSAGASQTISVVTQAKFISASPQL